MPQQTHHWVRGFRGQVLRDRRDQPVGRVIRIGRPVEVYAWQTAGCHGSVRSLAAAKRLVEEAVRRRLHQGDLFDRTTP